MTVERNKGRSLIENPDRYVVIDTETTGLDPEMDNLIELAAIRYENGAEVARFSELVQPEDYYVLGKNEYDSVLDYALINGKKVCFVDEFITELTGITNAMLAGARGIKEVLPEYLSFIGDDVLVGHNVNFDINFIYDSLKELNGLEFTNDFIDTMRMSRKVLPALEHHRLMDLADHYGVDYSKAHRAVEDCAITQQCFSHMANDLALKYGSFKEGKQQLWGSQNWNKIKAADIQADTSKFDEENMLFGKVCVITGTLEHFTRTQAMQKLADIGAVNADSVTAKTNYLILGNFDYSSGIRGGKSTKLKKAEALKLKGKDIEIISENVFLEMLGDFSN